MKTRLLIIIASVGVLISIPHAFASESQGIQIFQPDVELLPDQKIVYGESFTIHAWLQSYENRPDGLGFFVDVLDPQHNQVDSTLWFAKSDFVYTFDTTHHSYNITQSGTYYVQLETANFHERTESFPKTITFEILFPEPEQYEFVSDKCGPGTSLQNGICVVDVENSTASSGSWGAKSINPKAVSDVIPPPLKQVKDGVPINLIKCNESLQLEWKRDLQPICVTSETAGELIKRGVIKLRLGMPAENITQERLCVWYPENPLIQRHCDWETNILFTFKDEGLAPAYDEMLRLYAMEKRQLFRDFQFDTQEKYGSEHMWELLPSHYMGYDYHREALEFGIHHEVFDEESAPKYVEFIRSVVGENVNLTVRPAYPIVPQSFPTGEFFDD
ncbi:MAG: hypothetical protein KGZ34_02510 [Nitrosarchaeum sp.]|nr:hypothetical protein [Nitrosarchaeum sp.]